MEIKETKCKDCMLTKLNNPKNPICNYHQGVKQGIEESRRIILKEYHSGNYPTKQSKADNLDYFIYNIKKILDKKRKAII